MKIKSYSSSFNSLGIIISKDVVLSQWEPYENVTHFEPYITLYWFKRQIRFMWEVSIDSWLGKRLLAEREQAR